MSSNSIDTIPNISNKYVTGTEKITTEGIDYSKIFTNEFENGETALDETNMNTLLYAIEKNNLNIKHIYDYLNNRIVTIDNNFKNIDTTIENIDNTIENLDNGYATDAELANINNKLSGNISDINTALDNLEDKNVLSKKPTLTITYKDTGLFELGTKVRPSFTYTFDDGEYKYGCVDSNGTKYTVSDPTGVSLNGLSVNFNGQTLTTIGAFEEYTVGLNRLPITSNFSYQNKSTKTPISNLGRRVENKKIGDSNTNTAVIKGTNSVSGYMMGCFYGTTNTDITIDTITSDIIRSLNKSNNAYIAGNLTLDVPVGAKAIIIACPTTSIGPINVLNTTVNAKMTELFGSDKIFKTMAIKDASGTDYTTEYNVWMYKPAEAYTSTASLNITLG